MYGERRLNTQEPIHYPERPKPCEICTKLFSKDECKHVLDQKTQKTYWICDGCYNSALDLMHRVKDAVVISLENFDIYNRYQQVVELCTLLFSTMFKDKDWGESIEKRITELTTLLKEREASK